MREGSDYCDGPIRDSVRKSSRLSEESNGRGFAPFRAGDREQLFQTYLKCGTAGTVPLKNSARCSRETEREDRAQKQLWPGQRADPPSSSSMRSNRLYLATRSLRLGAPVLIWPAFRATARSAMVVSSVSPDRWETTAV
jgi:hypothetical protein